MRAVDPVPDWGTLPRMLLDQAARHPEAVVIDDDGARTTLRDLLAAARRTAAGLVALGVAPGDRVAIWGVNDPTWVVRAFGVWLAGGIVVPLSARCKGLEAAGVLGRTGVEVLLTGDGPPDAVLADLLPPVPGLRHVVVPGHVGSGGPRLAASELLAAGAAAAGAVEERALAVRPDDLCEIMSTSGTTGTPKGVMLDHAQVLRGYWDWAEIVTLGEGDRYPVIAPFSHGFGLNAGLVACVLRRATMLPVRVFSPGTLMALVSAGGASVLAGPPTLFHRLLEELDRGAPEVTSLRVAICGAAAVPPSLITRLVERVGLERMINAYGLMEGTVVAMTRAGDPVEVVAATAGRPVPGIEVRIVDDDGKDVPAGERGEILQRGYGVMRGYWDEPGRTAEVVDEDGWLHTGDVGVLDEAGNLAVVDRKKDLYIVNGFNVSPAEVEALLLREGSLAQVAVVGVPDAVSGEAGWAYVVPGEGASVAVPGLLAWARANMSGFKVPKRVVVVDALPVNANGKVDKPALRAAAMGET
ncbi:acyl-CoA synthetase (AMP-forming)/AMP-acid ligase II [Nonomuraea muscovyensis]|uniref:Acyl-CoA synthetase (AMP-forming)/AMP-acid ligase II n=2 Tax=Nonomuraea muscovyensis TaxID=1124761 RepID=A0A7X0C058_9ACTN|nr:AMP-binding protein [Nonomuraea muscovyensis]MBB6344696.1 acyl-CoA synthetase (AMP-forming)/AMP-acid ligase II [Nonomuraea muscovyensis]